MYLVSLIYASKVTDISREDIDDILSKAEKYNSAKNLTGALLFNSNSFLQCLEGSRKEVNKIYQKILHDKRHEDVIILDYKEVYEREFGSWSMAYIPNTLLSKEDILHYSGSDTFKPHEMQGESAKKLLITLIKRLPELQSKT